MLKISGEALAGGRPFGIDNQTITNFCRDIVEAAAIGARISLVIGGGNIFRGVSDQAAGMDRASADYMGMLATVMNCRGRAGRPGESWDCPPACMSAITMREVCEPYIRRRALRHLEKGRVVICAAGTGNPYFTTDTAAALRAMELKTEAILKGTKVDGVYDKDPLKHPDAVKFDSLTYMDVLEKRLRVMDTTAISLAMDNNMPIVVFNMFTSGNLKRVLAGEPVGTVVKGGEYHA